MELVPKLAGSAPLVRRSKAMAVPGWGASPPGSSCKSSNAATAAAHLRLGAGFARDDGDRSFRVGGTKKPLASRDGEGTKLGCFALTEPGFGSNPGGLRCHARKTADGYRLSGAKRWIGNGTIADVAVVWAKVDGEAGVDPESADAIRGFLVEKGTPGFSARLIEGKLSLRAALTAELEFNDCALSAGALLPQSGGLRSPLTCLNHARYGIAWGAIGAAMACYDEARQYAMRREQFGRPIAGFQLVQEKLARMLTEITKAQLLAHRLAQLKDAGAARHYHISMAKMNNVEIALDTARGRARHPGRGRHPRRRSMFPAHV